jgi:hypothetical protein
MHRDLLSAGRAVSLMIALSVSAIVSCGGSGTSSRTTAGAVMHIDASRAKIYHSLREVAADAELVIRVTATTQHSVDLVQGYPGDPIPTPFTVTTVALRDVLKGPANTPNALMIRQIGASNGTTVVDGAPPILQSGRQYLLFLDQFTYGPGRATDQYVLVGGGAGLFADNGATVSSLDPESPDLPRNATVADVTAVLSA